MISVTAEVTVTVESGESTLGFDEKTGCYAEKDVLDIGESTILHWNANPAEAKVTIAGNPEDPTISALADCSGSADLADAVAASSVTSDYPAAGCAVINPQTTTVYTVTASLGEATATWETNGTRGEEKP